MVSFVELGRMGRLGNQLFQYAALKSLALNKGYEVKIPDPSNCEWHEQPCLLGNFSLECDYLNRADVETIRHAYYEPDINRYDRNILNLPDNTNLSGFFQSTKYFEAHRGQIKREFTLKGDIENESKERLAQIKKDNKCEIVSLHLRRGDLTDGTTNDPVNYLGYQDNFDENSIFGRYLGLAKKVFENKKVKFLVFSGGSRSNNNNTSDIDWCKNKLIGDEYIFSEGNSALQDFSLIKNCDHNITSHSTTFGWWAAYLNEHKDKIVCAPEYYFLDDRELVREDFYPQDWRRI
tara:strand:+ start:2151 stop:3026 length:876 start_codon:yes stop_codon:yes gene_type:complete